MRSPSCLLTRLGDRVAPIRRLAGSTLAALGAVVAPTAQAASSASFQVNNAVVDSAGGTSASTSHQVTACIGSEIAGAQASTSFRIDSGCGPTALALASDFPPVVRPDDGALAIPALSDVGLALLVVAVVALAARRLRALRG